MPELPKNHPITIAYFESFSMQNDLVTGKFHSFSDSRVYVMVENPVRKKVLVPLESVFII